MSLSVIDIGSNTFLLLVGEPDLSRFYVDTERFVGLGEGLVADGLFSPSSLERARSVLREYRGLSSLYGAYPPFPFGTEAVRRSGNREVLMKIVKEELGVELDVLTGEKEALLSHTSCYMDLEKGEKVVSVDVGGGSTEVVCGTDRKIEFLKSFPVGSVVLTRKLVKSDPPSPGELEQASFEIRSVLGERRFPVNGRVVFFGGTAATLFMLALGIDTYDPSVLNMRWIEVDDLDHVLRELSKTTRRERIDLGVPPGRADFIVVGSVIVREVVRWLGVDRLFYSSRGVRYGYFMEKAKELGYL